MAGQVKHLWIPRSEIDSYLVSIGYWATQELRRKNTYVLSPAAYALTCTQSQQLEVLARTVYAAMRTLSERLSALSQERSLTNSDAQFLALANAGIRGLLGPKDIGGAVPPIMKVDMMQDTDGCYRIAEVDAYNPRGLAFMALLDESLPKYHPPVGGGVAAVARMMKACGGAASWTIIVSEMERFYKPALHVLQASLTRQGVTTNIVDECDISNDELVGEHVLIIPESLNRNIEGRARLVARYRSGELKTLYPPAAYLGSKAFLPFLSQQAGMSQFIPSCSLVSKKTDPASIANGTPTVLKGVMSSGLKQVIFSDDDAQLFAAKYAEAREMKRPSWILQHSVQQESIRIPVYLDESDTKGHFKEYFLRITAQISETGLVGVEVTGRPDKKVHGAPDCIQIPVVHR